MLWAGQIFSITRRTVCLALLLAIALASCTSHRSVSGTHAPENSAERKKDEALIKKYEDIIGIPISMKRSLALYKTIDGWMGVPYCYGAMCKQGTDCSGFTAMVYKAVYHINLQRSTEDQMAKDIRRIREANLQEGDLVFFKIVEGKKTSHVGIYLGNHKFVHASTHRGVCINDLTEAYYTKHFTQAGRVTTPRNEGELTGNEL